MTLPVPADQTEKGAKKRDPLHHNFPAEPPGQRSGEGREPYGSVGRIDEAMRYQDAALRLYDAVGFEVSVAVRLSTAGYDVSDWWPVVDPGVAS